MSKLQVSAGKYINLSGHIAKRLRFERYPSGVLDGEWRMKGSFHHPVSTKVSGSRQCLPGKRVPFDFFPCLHKL